MVKVILCLLLTLVQFDKDDSVLVTILFRVGEHVDHVQYIWHLYKSMNMSNTLAVSFYTKIDFGGEINDNNNNIKI